MLTVNRLGYPALLVQALLLSALLIASCNEALPIDPTAQIARPSADHARAPTDAQPSLDPRPLPASSDIAPAPHRLLTAEATGTSPTVAQGGIVDFNLRTADREHPFRGTPRIVHGARGLWLSSLSGSSRLVGFGLVDALVPEGPLDLQVNFSDKLSGRSITYDLPADAANTPQITARAATVLTAGVTQSGEKLATPRQSNLYLLTTSADSQLLFLRLATAGSLLTSTLAGAVAPASGRFKDGRFFYASVATGVQSALALLPQKGDQYIALLAGNLGGGSDYGYSITARVATARSTSAKEGASPDTPAAPLLDLTLDGPYYATDGALDSATDVDYVRVKATRDGRVYVQATVPNQGLGGSAGLGVAITWTQADCTTALAPQRPVQQEAPLTTGTTACAIVSSPTGYVGPYQLLISPEL